MIKHLLMACLLGIVPALAHAQTIAPGAPGMNYIAADVAGVQTGIIGCGSRAVYDSNTSGSTELVPAVSGKSIYVCGYAVELPVSGGGAVELDYGAGTACATGTVKLIPAWTASLVDASAFYRGLGTPASQALCIKRSSAVAVQAIVYFTQF